MATQQAVPQTTTQLIHTLTKQGFILTDSNNETQYVSQNAKGEFISDYLPSIGFKFLDIHTGRIGQPAWAQYVCHDLRIGIVTNGERWTWDNTAANYYRQIMADMQGQAEQDYKQSNMNWDA